MPPGQTQYIYIYLIALLTCKIFSVWLKGILTIFGDSMANTSSNTACTIFPILLSDLMFFCIASTSDPALSVTKAPLNARSERGQNIQLFTSTIRNDHMIKVKKYISQNT